MWLLYTSGEVEARMNNDGVYQSQEPTNHGFVKGNVITGAIDVAILWIKEEDSKLYGKIQTLKMKQKT